MAENILIVGAGAIGCFYGSLLARAGQRVSMVVRSDYEIAQAHGITVESILGHWNFKPEHIVKTARDYPEQAAYVVLCTKVTGEVNRVELIRDVVSSSTVIVLIQNGIDIEAEIAQAFPANLLISGLAFICATKTRPAYVEHSAYGRLAVGDYPQGISDATRAFAAMFDDSGIECITTDDVVTARWQKTVWNAPFNPISVLSNGLDTQTVVNTQETYLRKIMSEVAEIARALKHPLRDDVVDLNIESTRKMPPYKTSMLIDYQHGRTMETEAILGNAVRAGQAAAVNTPYLSSLYALMKLREAQIEHLKTTA
ncbi:MAG TPA: 2-dehydropantoate 2-reductase [Crenotrichaceae bacterium]|nr:2-dehydropantoate 2-reductase [Crenotrichaceae bacterium]